MNEEKQIEEMAKELCGMNVSCKDCRLDKLCLARNSADILYNAGYRKQSEGEWYVDDLSEIIKCKLCDDDAPISTVSGEQYKARFCQHCGAKMKNT